MTKIPFNKACHFESEIENVTTSLQSNRLSGNNHFAKQCIEYIKEVYKGKHVFLTPSCTHALEMGAILADLQVGDEVILPSYTFSSTVNAIRLRGAVPVFCEIETDTMNIDVNRIESLITDKTKMLLPIDYMGIPCDVDKIMDLGNKHQLTVMVDAAQSQHSKYKGEYVGNRGDLVTFSFHETKNISCGEGGALIVNKDEWERRSHFIQEKGTDRSLVLAGVKSKYSWVDIGSSFLLSDILASILLVQLENADTIVSKRSKVVQSYFELYESYHKNNHLSIPQIPDYAEINNHAFFVIFNTEEERTVFLAKLREYNVYAYIGYMPLHSSPMGISLGYRPEDLPLTYSVGNRIVRLPCYTDLQDDDLEYCLSSMQAVLTDMFG